MSTETISADLPVAIDDLPAEHRRWAAAAIFTALAMASLDTAIANIALPAIAADLHASPANVIWVVNVYRIAMDELSGRRRSGITGLSYSPRSKLECAPRAEQAYAKLFARRADVHVDFHTNLHFNDLRCLPGH